MRERPDAFGHLVWDFFSGVDNTEIIERDDGLIQATAGPALYFSTPDEWPDIFREALGQARGRILDIGCGAGRHTLAMHSKGYDVVGIDVSPLALEVCRKRGAADVRCLPVTGVNSRLGQFDTILMLGNNFGLLANPRRARWLLRRFYRMSSPEGLIIAENRDPFQTDDPIHLAYHERNRQRGRMAGQVRIRVRYKNLKDPWFDYLFVSQQEMMNILEGTGWRVKQFIDCEDPQYLVIIEKESV